MDRKEVGTRPLAKLSRAKSRESWRTVRRDSAEIRGIRERKREGLDGGEEDVAEVVSSRNSRPGSDVEGDPEDCGGEADWGPRSGCSGSSRPMPFSSSVASSLSLALTAPTCSTALLRHKAKASFNNPNTAYPTKIAR